MSNTYTKPITKRPSIKPKGIKSTPDEVRLLLVDVGQDGATIPLDRHEPYMKAFMDHGLMYDPNNPCPRFPTSRDFNMPDIKCSRRTCTANYGGKCTMPSLIEIGPKGCKGYHKRQSGKKK